MSEIEMKARIRMLELLLELRSEATKIEDHEKWIRVNTAIDTVAEEIQNDP